MYYMINVVSYCLHIFIYQLMCDGCRDMAVFTGVHMFLGGEELP
jgi:hypothetical protein